MACLRGFEPRTYCLEGSCSIQLSYRHILERVMGIEPTQSAWKAEILAIELHPQIYAAFIADLIDYNSIIIICQDFFSKSRIFFLDKLIYCLLTEILPSTASHITLSPSLSSPFMNIYATSSSIRFCITRRSGLAPYLGS